MSISHSYGIFSCLGYLITESGGPQIMMECEVLAPGSLNGCLSGRHYNRCKCIHPILDNELHILQFTSFLDANGPLSDEFLENLRCLNAAPSPSAIVEIVSSPSFNDLMNKYDKFSQDTRRGIHGATAQYWMMYIDLVELYMLFSRAIRTNDLDLYIYCLAEMVDIMFALNHIYARVSVTHGFGATKH